MINNTLPHRRQNPLTGDWILVSPQRNKRPWNGAIEAAAKTEKPEYDPACYLCPGNRRASGQVNPGYTTTFAFTNDHAALLPDVGSALDTKDGLFVTRQESGTSRVICYSPSHAKTMADLTPEELAGVVSVWKTEYETLGGDPHINHVQIFENKGAMMGASNPHPHCQIWANESIPTIPAKEQESQEVYLAKHHKKLLEAYLAHERTLETRIVGQNDAFAVLVPYWATWPYETMVLPKRSLASLSDFSRDDERLFADVLSRLTRAYDKLFSVSFPYSMGIHQAPTDKKKHDEWQFHMHFYPPLLRSATIKKHYVGYEMMAEGQRDLNPEDAARTLRDLYEKKFFGYSIGKLPGTHAEVITLSYTPQRGPSMRIQIAPGLGSNMFAWEYGGHPIIYHEPNLLKTFGFTGNFVLFPTPNRVRDYMYAWEGKTIAMKKRGKTVEIHGLVFDEAWEHKNPTIGKDNISLTTSITINKTSPLFAAFPFPCKLTLEYILYPRRIRVVYSVKNQGNGPLPYGFGLHPYFSRLSGDKQTYITIPAKDWMESPQSTLLPTGNLTPVKNKPYDITTPKPVGALKLDHVYTNLQKGKFASVEYRTLGFRVLLKPSADFTHMVVYTGHPDAVCIENQTCSTDAHNLWDKGFRRESHLIIIPKGQSHTGHVDYVIAPLS